MISTIAAAIYVAGVVIGLLRVDGSVTTKVGVALVWPLGLLAFVVTIATLVAVAAIVFPMFGLTLVATLVATWLLN